MRNLIQVRTVMKLFYQKKIYTLSIFKECWKGWKSSKVFFIIYRYIFIYEYCHHMLLSFLPVLSLEHCFQVQHTYLKWFLLKDELCLISWQLGFAVLFFFLSFFSLTALMASWVPVPFYLYLCVKSVHPSGPWFPLKRSVDIYVSSVQPTPQGQEWHLIGHHQNVPFLVTRDKAPQNRDHKIYCLNWLLLRVKDINNYAGKADVNCPN